MFNFNAYITYTLHFSVLQKYYMMRRYLSVPIYQLPLLVHPTLVIECFDHRCDLSKEPHLRVLVRYQYKLVVVLARLVRESDAVVLGGDTLYHGQRKIPL